MRRTGGLARTYLEGQDAILGGRSNKKQLDLVIWKLRGPFRRTHSEQHGQGKWREIELFFYPMLVYTFANDGYRNRIHFHNFNASQFPR